MVSHKQFTGMMVGAIVAAGAMSAMPQMASAETWTPFIIRNSNVGGVAPTFLEAPAGTLTVHIPLEGQKVGYGTADFNGQLLSSIDSMTYVPIDPVKSVGPPVIHSTPYTNVWVTDGTHFAVLTPYSAGNTEVLGQAWSGLNMQVNETTWTYKSGATVFNANDMDWLYTGAQVNDTGSRILTNSTGSFLTFADLAPGLTIASPNFGTYSFLDANGNLTSASTGAPRNGDGINLVFGDTHANYNNADPYVVSGVSVTATPEPASLSVMALGAVGLLARRRRRSA